jgi:hypothetical protein
MPRTDGLIRELAAGERAIAERVFGDSLNADAVRIRCAKWFMFQPAWVVMAPDGDIWLHPNGGLWCADFSVQPLPWRSLFVHEMTHVWQHQQGINLILKRRPFSPYAYLPLVPGRAFERYGIEQQAVIVEHYYRLLEGSAVAGAAPIEVYEALIPFAPRPRRA